MINEGSSWLEIAPIQNKFAEEIMTLVDDIWFARYQQCLYCIHDNGGEFIGSGFKETLESYGIKPKATTVKNPQNNRLHENMHIVLCEMIRIEKLFVPEESIARKRILQCAALAIRLSPNMISNTLPVILRTRDDI